MEKTDFTTVATAGDRQEKTPPGTARGSREDGECLLAKCSPNCGRCCAAPLSFTLFLSFAGFTSSLLGPLFVSQVTSVERQFQMSSTQTGGLMAANDVGFLSLVLLVAHFGKTAHVPRVLAAGSLLFGLAAFAIGAMNFVKPQSLKDLSGFQGSVASLMDRFLCRDTSPTPYTNQTMAPGGGAGFGGGGGGGCGDGTEGGDSSTLTVVIFMGLFFALQGVSKATRAPLGVTYIDDNVPCQSKTGFYVGIMLTVMFFGPPLGFFFGGLISNVPVDISDTSLSVRDPRWISAWWLGFLLSGSLSLIAALPLACFPRRLPRPPASPEDAQDNHADHDQLKVENLRNEGQDDLQQMRNGHAPRQVCYYQHVDLEDEDTVQEDKNPRLEEIDNVLNEPERNIDQHNSALRHDKEVEIDGDSHNPEKLCEEQAWQSGDTESIKLEESLEQEEHPEHASQGDQHLFNEVQDWHDDDSNKDSSEEAASGIETPPTVKAESPSLKTEGNAEMSDSDHSDVYEIFYTGKERLEHDQDVYEQLGDTEHANFSQEDTQNSLAANFEECEDTQAKDHENHRVESESSNDLEKHVNETARANDHEQHVEEIQAKDLDKHSPETLVQDDQSVKKSHDQTKGQQDTKIPQANSKKPEPLADKDKEDTAPGIDIRKMTFKEILKELPRSLCRLLRSPVYVLTVVSLAVKVFALVGYSSFVIKFMYFEFDMEPQLSSYIFGAASLVFNGLGTFCSGILASRVFKTRRQCLWLTMATHAVSVALIGITLGFSCDPKPIAGLDGTGECRCDVTQSLPVCSGNQTFVSPCSAGCNQTINATHFTGCRLSDVDTVSVGVCSPYCKYVVAFIVLQVLASTVGSFSITPTYVVVIRSVDQRDKTLALGLLSFLMSLLGFIPGPIAFGAVIDSTCLAWSSTCDGAKGVCTLYDIKRLHYEYLGLKIGGSIVSMLFCGVSLVVLMWQLRTGRTTDEKFVKGAGGPLSMGNDKEGEEGEGERRGSMIIEVTHL